MSAPLSGIPAPRICVVRLSALGDVVLAWAAIRALALHLPRARIVWLTGRPLDTVLGGLPANVEVLGIAKPEGIGDYLALRRRFSGERFDALLAMQASFRANLLYPCIRAPLKLGYDRRLAREGHGWFVKQRIRRADEHLLDGFMAFVQELGVPPAEPVWSLPLDAGAQEWVRAQTLSEPYVLINPSSSKADRNWPAARSAELARLITQRHGLRVVLCGGPAPAEREIAAAIAAQAPGVINLAGQTHLPQLFALIAGARVLVSPDSGPVHIARAYEVPVVGLYADARPEKSGPYGRLQWTVNRYPQALLALRGKDAAQVDWHQRVHDPRAMELITVAEVAAQFEQSLRQSPAAH